MSVPSRVCGSCSNPVEIKGDRIEVAGQVRQNQRAAGEADQADPVDVLRLVLQERPDLRGCARKARRRDVVRAHRGGTVQDDHQVLALVLRLPRGELGLGARQREDNRPRTNQRERDDAGLTDPGGAARERPETGRDRGAMADALQIEDAHRAKRNYERQELPPRGEFRTQEAHAGQPTRRGDLPDAVGGRSSCISWRGGVLGCRLSSAARRVVSSKSNLVSQSAGADSTALRNSSSARLR